MSASGSAGHGDQVAIAADLDCADIVGYFHVGSSDRGCAFDGIHRRHAAGDHDFELARAHVMRQHAEIGAEKNRYTGVDRFFETGFAAPRSSLRFCA